jgi:hypothetical protein
MNAVNLTAKLCTFLRAGLRTAVVLLITSLLLPAWAHKPSDSYLTLSASEGSNALTVRWDIALRDLDYVLQLDRDGDAKLTWGEVRQRADDITRYASDHLQLRSGDAACPLQATAPLMLDRHSDGTYAVLSLTAQCASLQKAVQARYSLLFDVDPSHRGLVQWVAPSGSEAQALVFGTESAEQTLRLQPPGWMETLRQYLVDGTWHIWIGYDHILFLLALLLPCAALSWAPPPTAASATSSARTAAATACTARWPWRPGNLSRAATGRPHQHRAHRPGGPLPAVGDAKKIVSIDPWGASVQSVFAEQLARATTSAPPLP